MEVFFGILVFALVCAWLGAYVSTRGRRSGWEGFILGGLFGPLGVLIAVALLFLPND
jgi:hypothetical protein